jgi:hypothetical protein
MSRHRVQSRFLSGVDHDFSRRLAINQQSDCFNLARVCRLRRDDGERSSYPSHRYARSCGAGARRRRGARASARRQESGSECASPRSRPRRAQTSGPYSNRRRQADGHSRKTRRQEDGKTPMKEPWCLAAGTTTHTAKQIDGNLRAGTPGPALAVECLRGRFMLDRLCRTRI